MGKRQHSGFSAIARRHGKTVGRNAAVTLAPAAPEECDWKSIDREEMKS